MVHDDINSPESRLIGGQIQKNKDKAKAANPITYISKNTPPFLIIHGMNDLTVPYCQSKILHNILKEKGKIPKLVFSGGFWSPAGIAATSFYPYGIGPAGVSANADPIQTNFHDFGPNLTCFNRANVSISCIGVVGLLCRDFLHMVH